MVRSFLHKRIVVFGRTFLCLLFVFATLSQFGCSANPEIGRGITIGATSTATTSVSTSEDIKGKVGTIGVSKARLVDHGQALDMGGLSQNTGAMSGALEGLKKGAGIGFVVDIAFCRLGGCVFGAGAIVGTVVGGAWGAISGAFDQSVTVEFQEEIQKIEDAIATEPLQIGIANQMVESLKRSGTKSLYIEDLPTAHGSSGKIPDTVLETDLRFLRLWHQTASGDSRDPHFILSMQIRSRLKSPEDAVELSRHNVWYESRGHSLFNWGNNDAALLREELKTASKRLAQEMVDFLVLRYPVEVKPLKPLWKDDQPILRWMRFPEQYHKATDDALRSSRVQRTEYELRVLSGNEILYERTGLHNLSHEIEKPLPPCRFLDWKVRARFELDEIMRVSRWTPRQSLCVATLINSPCVKAKVRVLEDNLETIPYHRRGVSPESTERKSHAQRATD